MMARLGQWWIARSAREQLMLKACAVVLAGVFLPLAALRASISYRDDARVALSAAQDVARDVDAIAAATARQGASPLPDNDGTLRGVAFAAAEAQGLTIARVEPAGPDRLRVVFAPSSSAAVYRWLDLMARRGLFVSKTAITREGEAGLVVADFEIARSP